MMITPRILKIVIVLAGSALIFAMPFRFIVWHFENGGYVLDSGWFAYLLETTDVTMPNPASINDLSFYAHHISPIFLVFAWLNKLTINTNGIYVFAFLNALSLTGTFALLTMSLKPNSSIGAVTIGVLLTALFLTNEFILRTIGYPHYELLFLLCCAIMLSGLYRKNFPVILLGAVLFLLTREDGGFYAAYICLCYLLLSNQLSLRIIEIKCAYFQGKNLFILLIAVGAISLSIGSIILQRGLYPEFGTFSGNFAGDKFSHVTVELVSFRVKNFLFDAGGGALLASTVVLALLKPRLILPFVLMSPLLMLHLIAIRDELGLFRAHYALPFFIILLVCLYDLFVSTVSPKTERVKAFAFAFVVFITSAQFARFSGQEQNAAVYFQLANFASIELKIDEIDENVQTYAAASGRENCASIGVVAFEPAAFNVEENLENSIGMNCNSLLLFRGDLFYEALRSDPEFTKFNQTKILGKLEYYVRVEE